jgi:hypothetical protein
MLRVVVPVLFGVGGVCLILLAALGAPSFWYIPCFYSLPLLAGVWAWRPRLGAALSVGPLISVAVLLHCLSGVWLAFVLLGLLTALPCVFIAAKESGTIATPLALSLGFVCASFLADRAFTNKVVVRSYEMNVSLDGIAPWGTVGPEWDDAIMPTVLYRRVGDGYCYVAFKSEELRERLAHEHRTTVSMQINILKDFGKERGYNVRSVGGLFLADGPKVVKDAERFGGHILDPGIITTSSTDSCW